jgi:serine protease Do
MLQGISQKFRGGCMMLVRDEDQHLNFLGSTFVVHRDGYLLTAAHLVNRPEGLHAVPTSNGDEFLPMTFDRVAAMPVAVVAIDADHDTALLRIDGELDIGVPDDFLGRAENVRPGASIMTLGYSFGHHQLHTVVTTGGFVAAKLRSPNETRLILFDKLVQNGDVGGPLIHAADGHIIGLVSGRFDPDEVVSGSRDWDVRSGYNSSISFAVAIDYGIELMGDQGLLEHR